MEEKQQDHIDTAYRLVEQKAESYFHSLKTQATQKAYIPTLLEDIQSWKKNHTKPAIVSKFIEKKQKSTAQEYHQHIRWLDRTGRLDTYLDRSISYIFLRDLCKTLDSEATERSVRRTVNQIKNYLTDSTSDNQSAYSMAEMYRWAQKENVESTIIWVIHKLKRITATIPTGMNAEQAQRKITKIIAGVLMHELVDMEVDLSAEERTKRLDVAIRMGYYYGLTYPFIDDLLDAKILSGEEERRYSDLIRTTLLTGVAPELGKWPGENRHLVTFVHSELKEAYEYMKNQQHPSSRQAFYEQSYVFFQSQEIDRQKHLSNEHYSNENLFIPIIVKAYSSRVMVRSFTNTPVSEGYTERAFYYGIYNQLADDFTDMFDDLEQGAVTPYTYYLTYHQKREDLLNPFELYWTVITHLLHHVYHSDVKTREVMLSRAINSLKRFKARMGTKKYNETMEVFALKDKKLHQLIQQMVDKATDVDFFDKLLRDHIIANLKQDREEKENFADQVKEVRTKINKILPISQDENNRLQEDTILDAANYSLKGDGKRLRPIITWVMGVNEYRLKEAEVVPLIRSLEYMHTASLIFDDLPSQDNAPIRRGKPTVHHMYNTAVAELTGLFLTQKAVEEQSSLASFDAKTVLELIHYSAQKTQEMCKGQIMDLESKGKQLTLEELNRNSFYKTGIAYEACLIMPAILAQAHESEKEALKKFAYHAGILFQIKDDLLDVVGEESKLGKPIGKDVANNNSNFVSVLGVEDAKKEMWEHYCLASEAMDKLTQKTQFLKHLLSYMLNRDY